MFYQKTHPLNIGWLDSVAIIGVDETNMALDLLPPLSSFAVVAIAEFGDKTQIAVISLSAKHRPRAVFIGSLLAFALVDGASALLGGAVAPFIPTFWIGIIAGISFLIFGIWTLFSREDMLVKIKEHSNAVSTSFFLITVMELGDKTQFAVIALAAEYDAPYKYSLESYLRLFC